MSLRGLASWRGVFSVWAPMLAIATLHYVSPPEMHWIHDVARRLFYVPILLAGMQGGVAGGLLAAVLSILLYSPHAFTGHIGHDPGTNTEKALEMVFYVVIGGTAGLLTQRDTRRRRELAAKDAQLARAARLESLGQLAAGLAHEIRNPLHAMRGTAEIVLDAVPGDAPEAELGRAHLAEIDRLSGVLSRFLDFARARERRDEDVRLDDVVSRVADLVRAQAGKQHVQVGVRRDGATVQGDDEELVQVVLAIALNGLQAMEEGGHLELVAEGRSLVVLNSGPPIAEADLERVFDPFFTTRDEGTGLGLSVAWRLVQANGGVLEVCNTPRGVRFEASF